MNEQPAATPLVEQPPEQVAEVDFGPMHEDDVVDSSEDAEQHERNLGMLYDIPLHVTARLGTTQMSIQDLLKLGPGAIVTLDQAAGESVDLLINGVVVGRGDVVVVNDNFGLRIRKVVSPSERIKSI